MSQNLEDDPNYNSFMQQTHDVNTNINKMLKKKKHYKKELLLAILFISALALIVCHYTIWNVPQLNTSEFPLQEQNLITATLSARKAGLNLLKTEEANEAVNQRSTELAKVFLNNFSVTNWVARISEIQYVNDNTITFIIDLDDNVKVSFTNIVDFINKEYTNQRNIKNSFLGDYQKNDLIVFSGNFIADDRYGIHEQSLTDYGSIMETLYSFEVSKLSKKP